MPGIGIVLNCCGKLSNDMGDWERFKKISSNTIGTFSRLGVEEVIVACINRHKMFRENSEIKLRTLYEVMLEKGLPENISGNGQAVSVHDSCPARHRPVIRNAIGTILSESGFRIEEMQNKNEFTQCCGAGGCAPRGNTALHRHIREYDDGWMNWFNRWYVKKRVQLTR